MKPLTFFLVFCTFVVATATALADEAAPDALTEAPRPMRLELEGNLVWLGRNDVRIPSVGGSDISLRDFKGNADITDRISFAWDINEKNGIKFLIFPFATRGEATPTTALNFQNTTFAAGVATQARYQFHSYRATYRYQFYKDEKWRLRGGFTAKVRNASISLTQGTTTAEKNDVGFVPLLHFNAAYRLADSWRIELDADALVAPQGRAEDVSLFAWYDISPGWEMGFGYRTLEGGADNKDVFTFAWLHFASVLAAFLF